MSKSRRQFTRLMLIVVSGLGLLSTALLLTDPPPAADFDTPPTVFQMNSSVLANSRQLASAPASVDSDQAPEALLNLDCNSEKQSFETTNLRFRLAGQNCGDSEGPISTHVKNLSNGYVATVFHKTPTDFTTDYINLSEGKNEISVEFGTETPPTTKTVTVFRNPASVKK